MGESLFSRNYFKFKFRPKNPKEKICRERFIGFCECSGRRLRQKYRQRRITKILWQYRNTDVVKPQTKRCRKNRKTVKRNTKVRLGQRKREQNFTFKRLINFWRNRVKKKRIKKGTERKKEKKNKTVINVQKWCRSSDLNMRRRKTVKVERTVEKQLEVEIMMGRSQLFSFFSFLRVKKLMQNLLLKSFSSDLFKWKVIKSSFTIRLWACCSAVFVKIQFLQLNKTLNTKSL